MRHGRSWGSWLGWWVIFAFFPTRPPLQPRNKLLEAIKAGHTAAPTLRVVVVTGGAEGRYYANYAERGEAGGEFNIRVKTTSGEHLQNSLFCPLHAQPVRAVKLRWRPSPSTLSLDRIRLSLAGRSVGRLGRERERNEASAASLGSSDLLHIVHGAHTHAGPQNAKTRAIEKGRVKPVCPA